MKKISAMVILLAAVAAGCSSGSSSGGSSAVPLMTITGKVSDPAVEGAKVELIDSNKNIYGKCGVNGNSLCNVWSKSDGSFVITLPLGSDISNFSLKSTGGTDTAYGTEITVSYTADINNYAGNYSNIILSPISSLYTNLLLSNTHDNAITILSSYFGLDKNVVLLDPERNGDLLKISYIINQIASNIGSDDAFSKIAALIKSTSQFTTDIDNMLASLFASNSQLQVSLKEMYQNVSSIQSQDVYTVLSSIQNLEKMRMFKNAYVSILENLTGAASSNALANIQSLFEQVNSEVVIPTSQFQIEQIVRFVASQTVLTSKKLNDYANFNVDAASFQATLNAVISDTALIADIKTLASETFYAVTVPLDSPLGLSDNQKRVDYYFNSTQDVGYQVRSLTKYITSDAIIDSLFYEITMKYAEYGLVDKAKNLADINIADNIIRINSISKIGTYAAKYDITKAKQYINEAKTLIDILGNSQEISADFVSSYAMVLAGYIAIGDYNTSTTMINNLFDNLLNKVTPDTVKFNLYNSTINKLYNSVGNGLIADLIEDGNYNEAIKVIEILIDIASTIPNNGLNTYYSVKAMGLSYPLNAINALYEKAGESYKAALQLLFNEAYTNFTNFISECETAASTNSNAFLKYYQRQIGKVIIPVHNFKGQAEVNTLHAKMKDDNSHGQAGILEASTSMAFIKVFNEGFESGKNYYEQAYPVGADYSKIADYNKFFAGYGDSYKLAITTQAIKQGNNILAKQSLDYIYDMMDKAVTYANTNKTALKDILFTEPTGTSISYSSIIEGKFDLITGLSRIFVYYKELGYLDNAKQTILLGEKYLTNLDSSLVKYSGYILLAYMSQLLNDTAAVEKYFAEAEKVTFISGISDKLLAGLYANKAYDVFKLNISSKNTKFAEYIQKAKQYNISYVNSISTDKDRSSAVSEFVSIAKVCIGLGFRNEYIENLNEAEKVVKNITTGTEKINSVTYLSEAYAKYDGVKEGYNVANRLLTNKADIYNVIDKTSSTILDTTSIDSDIAFVDTDRDGKPDFFLPNATPDQITASGLTLDDDIDGDGIKDDTDLLPYVANN